GKWIGLGTALAVILHKPFDAMAISTLMAAADTPRSARYWVVTLFALVTPLGIVSFFLGMSHFTEASPLLLGSALAFSAGTFLCISCSDLLPELHFHAHDRLWLSLALLAGLAVAVAILLSEQEATGHRHGDQPSQRSQIMLCG
ncbi:MAG TPA: ZIP family metal transporter, partial [Verrucomicrobiae bacterium]|nr:ZIP family metal transporter [Verrucomicrobiae bacterium]